MKRKKHLLSIIGFALILFGVSAHAIPQLQEYKKSKQIKAVADTYLQEKYGIIAEIQKYELHFNEYYLWMKEQDREFYLFLSEDYQPLHDNYQYDEICGALTDLIKETYPDIRSCDINIYMPEDESNGVIPRHKISLDKDTKFDGSNLEELLTGCSVCGTMYYAGTEFCDCTLFQKLQEWEPDIAFVNFDTQTNLEHYLQNDFLIYGGGVTDAEYYASDVLYAPYITQIWRIDKNGSHSTNYPVKAGDGFLYCCPEHPDTTYSTWEERESQDVHVLSRTYQFHGSWDSWNTVYVYYPADAVSDSTCISWTAENPGGGLSGIEKFNRCGDYQVFYLSMGFDPAWYMTDEQGEIPAEN